MSRMPACYQPGGGPLRWQDDVTGVLPAAVMAFLNRDTVVMSGKVIGRSVCTPEQVELVRDYCEYYINAPCWELGPEGEAYHSDFMTLRNRVRTLTTGKEIDAWLGDALDLGIDPL